MRYEDIDSAAEARPLRSLYGTIFLVLVSDHHHALPLLRRRADDRVAADLGVHRTTGDLIGHDLSDFFSAVAPVPVAALTQEQA